MDFSRVLDEFISDFLWIFSYPMESSPIFLGFFMDFSWIFLEFNTDFLWILLESFKGFPWMFLGFFSDLYGFSRIYTDFLNINLFRKIHGKFIKKIIDFCRILHGFFSDSLWI